MYYSAIGLLAMLVLLIENTDILLNRKGAFNKPAWMAYRRFLFSAIVYYITDIIWGYLESRKLSILLFTDTSIYFIAMAVGVLFWTQYVVAYLEEKNAINRFFTIAGRIIALAVAILTVVNFFVPILFTVDEKCVYNALPLRYVVLCSQILILLLISAYALTSIIRRKPSVFQVAKFRTMAFFGLIMAVFLGGQVLFEYLPLYSIAYMLGTCLIRAFVFADEKEEYRKELDKTAEIRELKQTISSLLDNMPALSFSKDAETGVYLACNQAFAEYAHKSNPEGVVGLTDAEIFDAVTARHFVEDDRMALSMDTPYIFFEDVPDAAGNQRQFQTTKLKFTDTSGRLCTLGMCQDVTDIVRIQREQATTKEAYEKARSIGKIYAHIAQALAMGYENLFYVNLETEDYTEYRTEKETGVLVEVRSGSDFFDSCIRDSNVYIHEDDRETVLNALKKDVLLDHIDRNKSFILSYRLIKKGLPTYFTMKAVRMYDDNRFIIIGVTNTDEETRRRRLSERIREEQIAYTRLNALAGDFLCVYVVVPETGRYREFSSSDDFKSFNIPEEGPDFFEISRQNGRSMVYHEDLDRFLTGFTRERVTEDIERSGFFVLTYRLVVDGVPKHVQLKITRLEEKEGARFIVGLNDIEELVRQEEEQAMQLAKAKTQANVDALTGVKNKHAYTEEEEILDDRISKKDSPEFAIVIMDVNGLKMINDSEGHQAGDRYIRKACKFICETFKKSPVFRVGGDEFVVVVEGDDYARLDSLIEKVNSHNQEACANGGIVVACGMSRFKEDDKRVAEVFKRADRLMYENKRDLKEKKGN